MAEIAADEARLKAFQIKTSLKAWERQGWRLGYMAEVLSEPRAARFPNRAAQRLNDLANTSAVVKNGTVVLLRDLARIDDVDLIRDKIMDRTKFGLKSASDFMISSGLSDDVVALDSRIIGLFNRYFEYRHPKTKVQANKMLYLSIENSLRNECRKRNVSLAYLDRVLFQLSGLNAIDYVIRSRNKP